MKALLLAAGVGQRLRPLTDILPKCLMPINGIPLIDYWLDLLEEGGISEVIVNTHYMADLVRNHLKKSKTALKLQVTYESELLGWIWFVYAWANDINLSTFFYFFPHFLICFLAFVWHDNLSNYLFSADGHLVEQ